MATAAVLDDLRVRARAIESVRAAFGRGVARLGGPFDAALPWGGLPHRALHEVSGLAATSAAAAFGRRFLGRGGVLIWCRNARLVGELGELDDAGFARFGLEPARVVVVRAEDDAEVVAAFEAALRCRGVACAVAEVGRLDLAASRRLQRVVEAGSGAGLILRPEPDPSPNAALTRWRAEPLPAAAGIFWRLVLWGGRGAAPGVWAVRWDEPTLSFAPAIPAADAALGEGRAVSAAGTAAG
ncbi:ImuA family protein [Benzoatithermus flavus]|uniref:Protein ImuA n=1 Tax=Benzoatithermus flavus TaxID=3108223 RepID=A0ABU8XXY9_9PROT